MRRGILDERGQTRSEHLGVMVLVAAIIVPLLATDIPNRDRRRDKRRDLSHHRR